LISSHPDSLSYNIQATNPNAAAITLASPALIATAALVALLLLAVVAVSVAVFGAVAEVILDVSDEIE